MTDVIARLQPARDLSFREFRTLRGRAINELKDHKIARAADALIFTTDHAVLNANPGEVARLVEQWHRFRVWSIESTVHTPRIDATRLRASVRRMQRAAMASMYLAVRSNDPGDSLATLSKASIQFPHRDDW